MPRSRVIPRRDVCYPRIFTASFIRRLRVNVLQFRTLAIATLPFQILLRLSYSDSNFPQYHSRQ